MYTYRDTWMRPPSRVWKKMNEYDMHTCMYTYTYVCIQGFYEYVHVYIYVCIHVYVYMYIYIRMYTYRDTWMRPPSRAWRRKYALWLMRYCMCMYVYIHVCPSHINVCRCAHIRMINVHTCIYANMYACMYSCTCIHACTYMYTCKHICMFVCVFRDRCTLPLMYILFSI